MIRLEPFETSRIILEFICRCLSCFAERVFRRGRVFSCEGKTVKINTTFQ